MQRTIELGLIPIGERFIRFTTKEKYRVISHNKTKGGLLVYVVDEHQKSELFSSEMLVYQEVHFPCPYPPELRWPTFSFIRKRPFLRKMSKRYFIYESNTMFFNEKPPHRKTYSRCKIYYEFRDVLRNNYQVTQKDFTKPITWDDSNVEMDDNWYFAHAGFFFKSNHCGVKGDLILIAKDRPDLKEWFDQNKPEFITEFINEDGRAKS